ncbi:Pyridoxal phosphatase [Bertholletia excelsa]
MDAGGMSSGAKYKCLLFDMDDTLYPLSSGLNLACRKNIEEFMLRHLHINENEVPRMCLDLYREYGTTMAGLKALGYEFDDEVFHTYVHGKLPYEDLKPDPVLRNLLLSMPQRKIIFTNADKAHAARVLNRLGLEDCFEGVICFETLNTPPQPIHYPQEIYKEEAPNKNGFDIKSAAASGTVSDSGRLGTKLPILCKPAVEAIEAAIRIANIDPKYTIFFDDSTRNIASGKAAGLHTVIVGRSILVPGADRALSSIHNIKEAIPEIWEGEQLEQLIQSTAIETVILA